MIKQIKQAERRVYALRRKQYSLLMELRGVVSDYDAALAEYNRLVALYFRGGGDVPTLQSSFTVSSKLDTMNE